MAIDMYGGSNGLNFNHLNRTLFQGIRAQETKLRNTISTMGSEADGSLTQTELLVVQQQVQQWTMMIELHSTITKQIADALRGVIQKSG